MIMNRNATRITVFVLAFTLIAMLLTACGDTKAPTVPSTGDKAEATTAPTQKDTEKPQDSQTFSKRVTIKVPVYDRGVEGQAPVDDNFWTRWIQKEFGDKNNITVEYVAIPRSDEVNKFNMLLAVGDAPDIIFHYDFPAAVAYQNAGAMQPIDLDMLQTIAPTYYKMNKDLDMLKFGVLNGEQYFIFAKRPTAYNYLTMIRQDWLDKVNMPMPQNRTEYKNALRAFKENQLGGLNTIPQTMALPYPNGYFANQFRPYPIPEEELALYSDLSVVALTWEPVKQAIKEDNELYNEGLVSPNFALDSDGNKMKADFVTGVAGVYGTYLTKEGIIDVLLKNVPDAKVSLLPYKATVPDGNAPAERAYWPFGMILGINSASTDDQVKAVMMLLEWMIQDENLFTLQNGIEGKNYNMGSDGLPVAVGDYTGEERMNYNSNKDMWCLVIEGKDYGSDEKNLTVQKNTFAPDEYGFLIQDRYEECTANQKYWYTDFLFDTGIASVSEYKSTLQEKFQEYYTRLVMCDPSEFEAIYEECCKDYLEAGFQKIIDEKLAAYNRMKN
jgi:putative aldouronate transport system substrate-binding protein